MWCFICVLCVLCQEEEGRIILGKNSRVIAKRKARVREMGGGMQPSRRGPAVCKQ